MTRAEIRAAIKAHDKRVTAQFLSSTSLYRRTHLMFKRFFKKSIPSMASAPLAENDPPTTIQKAKTHAFRQNKESAKSKLADAQAVVALYKKGMHPDGATSSETIFEGLGRTMYDLWLHERSVEYWESRLAELETADHTENQT